VRDDRDRRGQPPTQEVNLNADLKSIADAVNIALAVSRFTESPFRIWRRSLSHSAAFEV
jgi:hypothetical protein